MSYFVSDVHLGLRVGDPEGREALFVRFLRSIPRERTEAVYLLGDIWDFWYEYRDVVPKGYVGVFAALQELMEAGVNVFFFQGNHDVWAFRYFEELGMVRLVQPAVVSIGDACFCLGHGDGLGPGQRGYKLLRRIFHSRFLQRCFSSLHPWVAFRLGNGWSRRSRLGKSLGYTFRGADEPLYRFCEQFGADRRAASLPEVDYYVFGHYHCRVDMPVLSGGRLVMLSDWISAPNYAVYGRRTGLSVQDFSPEEGLRYMSGTLTTGGSSQKMDR